MVSLRQLEVLNGILEGSSFLNQEGTRPQRMSMRTRSEESASFRTRQRNTSGQSNIAGTTASPQLEKGASWSPAEAVSPPARGGTGQRLCQELSWGSQPLQHQICLCSSAGMPLSSQAETATNYNPLHILNSFPVRINLQQKAQEYFAGITKCLSEARPTTLWRNECSFSSTGSAWTCVLPSS